MSKEKIGPTANLRPDLRGCISMCRHAPPCRSTTTDAAVERGGKRAASKRTKRRGGLRPASFSMQVPATSKNLVDLREVACVRSRDKHPTRYARSPYYAQRLVRQLPSLISNESNVAWACSQDRLTK